MNEATLDAIYALFEPTSRIFTEDAELWVKLDDVLAFCRAHVRDTDVCHVPTDASGVSVEGVAWAMEEAE